MPAGNAVVGQTMLFFTLSSPQVVQMAARRSWVLREVFRGFSKEARTRGFPSPSFGGFGFIVICCRLNLSPAHAHRNLTLPLLLGSVCHIPVSCNVGLGSLAVVQYATSSMAAFLQSGRSDHQKQGEFRVRFRPQAVIHHLWVLFFSVMSTRLVLVERVKCRSFI